MNFELFINMILNLVGGLAVFLLGMRNMSEGMQAVAGNKLRRLIGVFTDNRLLATGIGTLVTAVIQSSSVTTVMVVGFVNSGFMALKQALGVIFGANIGTTITGWILVLKVGKYGLPLLGAAAFFHLFAKAEKVRFAAMAIMGIGMIFFGLELMKNGLKPITGIPEFETVFHWFTADDYIGVLKCALVGCALTVLVQSSSATIGITMALALTGAIEFRTAAALVLGENIGTTITALLASLGASTNAKRAAYGHVIFNVLGVLWITAIFPVYIVLIQKVLGIFAIDPNQQEHVTAGIAAVHTGFNVTNTIIFLPFIPLIARMLDKFVPDKEDKEAPRLTQLDTRLLESPVIGIEQSRVELLKMSNGTQKMMDDLRTIMTTDQPRERLAQKVFASEEALDTMQKEIVIFLSNYLKERLPQKYTEEGRLQLRMADEYESISDYVVKILRRHLRMRDEGLKLIDDERAEIIDLHDEVASYLAFVTSGLEDRNPNVISKARSQGESITRKLRKLEDRHLRRLSDTRMHPLVSSCCTDILDSYGRIRDHSLNIAEALAGEK